MYRTAEKRLARLINSGEPHLLKGGKIGLEKEGLRVNSRGRIAQTPHPAALGSALTHPYITTDYSEALTEFITPPFTDVRACLEFLRDAQKFVYAHLDDELLWATSMPCIVAGEPSIPIADYGKSNIGMMKNIYRRGLGYRYGRVMQVIAGSHFNYSAPDALWPVYRDHERDRRPLRTFIADSYMAMIRNLQRFGWLIPYLFGASPAVCKSFLGGRPTSMQEFDFNTYYEPHGTSLRMSDIGYQNTRESECGIKANYDSLDDYVASLNYATSTPCPTFEKIGVIVDGEYRQLNANILQIDAEYYSTVRPKQIAINYEKPTLALKRRGIQYIELRSLDIDAFDPLGIHEHQLRFLEAFVLFCLLHESPRIDAREAREIDANQGAAARYGRDPALKLQRSGRALSLPYWAGELCEALHGICELLDADRSDKAYMRALAVQRDVVRDPERTPSARMLAEMRKAGEGFFHYAMRKSKEYQRYFDAVTLSDERLRMFTDAARESLDKQHEIEATDELSFDEYLQRYFAQV
ncbi:MAG: glutamate--cysteine ligase [Pseudomonadota bacterium]|nr:glutamate--cysteine ligase [Pseudomonadota bacterium]